MTNEIRGVGWQGILQEFCPSLRTSTDFLNKEICKELLKVCVYSSLSFIQTSYNNMCHY